MKVFLTGGSGFLGLEIIAALRKEKVEMVALARSEATAKMMSGLGVQATVSGSLDDMARWQSALKGCDVVIHCAAPVEFWGPWAKYQKEIVDATTQLLHAADREGVKRFIYISSESVLQDTEPLLDVKESHPYPDEPNSFYGKSKKLAEQAILSSKVKIERLILRPTFIWGAKCNALEGIAETAKSGGFMWLDGGKAEFEAVHVKNVAEATRLAITKGKDRGIYFVTDGERATVREFFTQYFQSISLKVPTRSIPGGLVRGAARVMEILWPRSKKPPVTRFEVAFMAMPRRYDLSSITTDLGYRPIISRAEGFKTLT